MKERIEIYRNLHKKCWSIRSMKTRRVIGHAKTIALKDCSMHVSQAGRARVLREKRKNVHATIRGFRTTKWKGKLLKVSYNPYARGCFVMMGEEILSSDFCIFNTSGTVWGTKWDSKDRKLSITTITNDWKNTNSPKIVWSKWSKKAQNGHGSGVDPVDMTYMDSQCKRRLRDLKYSKPSNEYFGNKNGSKNWREKNE